MVRRRRKRRRQGGVRSQVYKNKKMIKRIANSFEYKWLDQQASLATVNVAGETICLNPINTGDSPNTKEGREITARRILIRGYLSNTNGTPEDGICRLMLVRYKQSKGANLAITDLIYNQGLSQATTMSCTRMENKEQFDIIVDTTFSYDTSQHTLIPFKIKKKFDHKVIFNSDATTGTTYSAIETNSLWLVAVTSQSTEANSPSIVAESRYSYCDA